MKVKMFNEFYQGQWDSSISEEDIQELLPRIGEIQKMGEDIQKFQKDVERSLKPYDSEVSDFVIDMLFYQDYDEGNMEYLADGIAELGDIIMNSYGTEPKQVLNAIEDGLNNISI